MSDEFRPTLALMLARAAAKTSLSAFEEGRLEAADALLLRAINERCENMRVVGRESVRLTQEFLIGMTGIMLSDLPSRQIQNALFALCVYVDGKNDLDCGDVATAISTFQRGAEFLKHNFGPNEWREVEVIYGLLLEDLGAALYLSEQLEEAGGILEQALDLWNRKFGSNHTNVALNLYHQAQVREHQNRLDEAEFLLEEAIKIYEESFPKDDEYWYADANEALARESYALLLDARGQVDEAAEQTRFAEKIWAKYHAEA